MPARNLEPGRSVTAFGRVGLLEEEAIHSPSRHSNADHPGNERKVYRKFTAGSAFRYRGIADLRLRETLSAIRREIPRSFAAARMTWIKTGILSSFLYCILLSRHMRMLARFAMVGGLIPIRRECTPPVALLAVTKRSGELVLGLKESTGAEGTPDPRLMLLALLGKIPVPPTKSIP